MPLVNTVTGPVAANALGLTLVHEHLRTWQEAVYTQFPHLYDEPGAVESAAEGLRTAARLGLHTLCDPTVMGLGRDVRFQRAVAERAGVRVIAATGIYTLAELPPYFSRRPVDHLAEAFIHDIEVGIQGSDIKAGVLKCAIGPAGLTPDIEKVTRAVARAHLATGVPILTHSYPASESGLVQLAVLEDEGVSPGRVLIGHCGDTMNIKYLERLAERGANLGLDRYGLDVYLPTPDRNRMLAELCRRGWSERLFISHDTVLASDWLRSAEEMALRRDSRLTFLLAEVPAQLEALGVGPELLTQLLVDNPRRLFGGTAG